MMKHIVLDADQQGMSAKHKVIYL